MCECLLTSQTLKRSSTESVTEGEGGDGKGLEVTVEAASWFHWVHFLALRLPLSWTLCLHTVMGADGCEITARHLCVSVCSSLAIETDRFCPLQRVAIQQRSNHLGQREQSAQTHSVQVWHCCVIWWGCHTMIERVRTLYRERINNTKNLKAALKVDTAKIKYTTLHSRNLSSCSFHLSLHSLQFTLGPL